eukprot:2114672-Rhodomonas_salina.1
MQTLSQIHRQTHIHTATPDRQSISAPKPAIFYARGRRAIRPAQYWHAHHPTREGGRCYQVSSAYAYPHSRAGTDGWYGATTTRKASVTTKMSTGGTKVMSARAQVPIALRAPYPVSGTDLAYLPLIPPPRSLHTDLACLPVRPRTKRDPVLIDQS